MTEAVPFPETEPRLRLLRDSDLDVREIADSPNNAVLSVGSSAPAAASASLSSSSSSSRSSPA